jgi:starch-binding outer membrane protein, SusD/RagB family
MNIHKSFTVLLGAATIFLATSCKKFLEVQPKNAAPDDLTIVDRASAQTALRGAYRSLASGPYYGTTFQFAIYLQGGELEWGDSRTVNLQFIQHSVQADNEEVQAVWSAIYQTINRANHVIAKVPAITDASFTETLKSEILGEAYFLRALSYFDLARTWGGVQIVLEPTVSATDKIGIPRSSLEETYAQVLSDLNAAEELLPETVNRIRATKKTVYALKARYHLYRQEWQAAADYASLLINDAENYALVYPYNAFFANNAVATNESIFETNYSSVYPNEHRDTWQPQDKGGIRRWFPSEAFVAAVTDPLQGGNRTTLVEKTADGRWYGNLYYRSNPKTDPSYVLRIAEQYLIRAEARAHLENIAGSLEDVNAIRVRSDLAPLSLSTSQELLLAVEQERRFEFAFEPHRWFDLVRTGRAGAVLNVTDANKYLLPLPANELSVDPALVQNPGY